MNESKSSKERGHEKHLESNQKNPYTDMLQNFYIQNDYLSYLKRQNITIRENEYHIVTNNMLLQHKGVWCVKIIDMNKLITNQQLRDPNSIIVDNRNGTWKYL